MIHAITLRFRDNYAENIQGDYQSHVQEDLEAAYVDGFDEVEVDESDDAPKTSFKYVGSLNTALRDFFKASDDINLSTRYILLSITSEED